MKREFFMIADSPDEIGDQFIIEENYVYLGIP